jgi:hypothetical protein
MVQVPSHDHDYGAQHEIQPVGSGRLNVVHVIYYLSTMDEPHIFWGMNK